MRAHFRSGYRRQAVKDWVVGLGLFVILAAGMSGDPRSWALSSAVASDRAVAQAIEVTSPPSLRAENAVIAALLQPPASMGVANRPVSMAILGLTFSLMFSFNLLIWRHLRRVYASPRRGVWRRGC